MIMLNTNLCHIGLKDCSLAGRISMTKVRTVWSVGVAFVPTCIFRFGWTLFGRGREAEPFFPALIYFSSAAAEKLLLVSKISWIKLLLGYFLIISAYLPDFTSALR